MTKVDIKTLTIEDLIQANIEHCEVLGWELEYTRALRAISAKRGIEAGITDPDELTRFCIDDIGEEEFNTVLEKDDDGEITTLTEEGDGAPYVRSYLALHRLFGEDWMIKAALAHFEYVRCSDYVEDNARGTVSDSFENYVMFSIRNGKAEVRWLNQAGRKQAAAA